jgi:predicted nucleotidyltransferase component of viral defense system
MLEKVIHLLHLLSVFQTHPFLKGRWALKGGTALNLFLLDVPRLSVDIDLNYVGAPERETMMAERPKLEEAIRAVCAREGFTIARIPSDHAGGRWSLRYASALGQGGNLEVDLNYMFRVPLWPIVARDSRRIGSFQATGVPLLDLHELAAGKLAALLARSASRDVFDVHQLLTTCHLDRRRLRLGFVIYGAINRRDWRAVSARDVSVDPEELQNQLSPMLRIQGLEGLGSVDSRPDRLLSECRELLSVVLPLEDPEREFLDRLLDHGEINPSLLTDDPGLAERIRSHPGLEWKAVNVRQFKRGSPGTGSKSEENP